MISTAMQTRRTQVAISKKNERSISLFFRESEK